MLRVNLFHRSSPQILFVLIGASHLDYGIKRGAGAQARWIAPPGQQAIDTETVKIETPLQALQRALASLSCIGTVNEIRVVVTDNWLDTAIVPWHSGMATASGMAQHARQEFSAAGCRLMPDDTIRLTDAPYGEPRLAVAYPAVLLEALRDLSNRHGARLHSVQPLSLLARQHLQRTNAVQAQAQAWCIVTNELLILAHGSKRDARSLNEVHVRTRRKDLTAPQEALHLWQRLCLRAPQWSAMTPVALLELTTDCELSSMLMSSPPTSSPSPSPSSPPPPFIQVAMRTETDDPEVPPGLSMMATAAMPPMPSMLHHSLDAIAGTPAMRPWHGCLLALLLPLLFLLVSRTALQTLRSENARHIVQDQSSTADRHRQATPRQEQWRRQDLLRIPAINLAIRQLNFPIGAVWRALQAPQDIQVALLSLESIGAGNAAISGVKLVAEAKTSADMARYVAFLSDRKPFTEATLIKHEMIASPDQAYRFILEARWND